MVSTHSERPFLFLIGTQKSGTTWLRDCFAHRCCFCQWQEWYLPEFAAAIEQHIQTYSQGMSEGDLEGCARTTIQAGWQAMLGSANADKSAYPCVDNLGRLRPELHRRAVAYARRYFPGARVVVLVRDPRAVLNSLQHYLLRQGWPTRIDVTTFAQQWVLQNRQWRDDKPDAWIRYEDLKRDFKRTLKHALCAADLPTSDPLISSVFQSEYDIRHHRARQPEIYRTGTIDEWRDNLSTRQLNTIHRIAGDFMQDCGYCPQRSSRPPTIDRGKRALGRAFRRCTAPRPKLSRPVP